MSLARIPAIVATSIAQVCLRSWSLQKRHEAIPAPPFATYPAVQESLVLTASAFSTSYRLLDQRSALRSDPILLCEMLLFKLVPAIATLSALDAILADACVRAVVR